MSPTTAICIRQFRDDDLPEVADIFEYGMMLYSKNDPVSRHRWAEYVRKSLKDDLADVEGTYMATGGNFWVATLENDDGESKVVGMIALDPRGNGEAEVRRVSVHPGYQRMGDESSVIGPFKRIPANHSIDRFKRPLMIQKCANAPNDSAMTRATFHLEFIALVYFSLVYTILATTQLGWLNQLECDCSVAHKKLSFVLPLSCLSKLLVLHADWDHGFTGFASSGSSSLQSSNEGSRGPTRTGCTGRDRLIFGGSVSCLQTKRR